MAELQADAVWQEALSELKLTMTKATFQRWLKDSHAVGGDPSCGEMTVFLQNQYAVDWVNGRLKDPILRTLKVLCGRDVSVEFLSSEPPEPGTGDVDTSAETAADDEGADPGERFTVHGDKSPLYGHLQVSHYASRFWRPFLGLVPFSLWELLSSYEYYVSSGKDKWPSINVLVAELGFGSRATVLGRSASGNRPAQSGAIDVLEQHRVARCRASGTGRTRSYLFQVRLELPLLTPAQVRALPDLVQKQHDLFLGHFGKYAEKWRTIDRESLLPPW